MNHISLEALQSKGALLLPSIQDGFNLYPYQILTKTTAEYLALFRQLIEINDINHSFADCYFGHLAEENKSELLSLLPMPWQITLSRSDFSNDTIYLSFDHLNDPIIQILAELSAKEYLFSSFYFTRYPCTIWTNYQLNYPIFYRDKETKFFYQGIV